MGLLIRTVITISGLLLILQFAGCKDEGTDRGVGTEVIDIPASLHEDNSGEKRPEITFDITERETGKINQGDVLDYVFPFTNTGEAPLIISSVVGSCGCTIPKNYPKGKILPGEGGQIEVTFDSDNKWGEQVVTINVTTNALPSLTQLIIRTNIIAPDNMKTNKQE